MALKRINKELTDLGRYVAPPPSPLRLALPCPVLPCPATDAGRRRLLARPPATAGCVVCCVPAAQRSAPLGRCASPRAASQKPNRTAR